MNNNQFDEEFDLEEEQDKMKLKIGQRERDANRAIRIRLHKIMRKEEGQLLLEDKKFLKARASYLTKGQREEYAKIIKANYYIPEKGAEPVEPQLEDLTRIELDKKALELGIEEPHKLKNIASVVEAIKEAQESLK